MGKEIYPTTAEENLAYAIRNGLGKRGEGYSDNKCLVSPEGIESLIDAGARIIALDRTSMGSVYLHEVDYGDHRFLAVTLEKHFSSKGSTIH